MATSGSLESLRYNNAHWLFKWSSEKISEGKTKVTWELYTAGRSSSPTQYYSNCTLKINGVEKYKTSGTWQSFTNITQSSGSFEVLHNANGEGSFMVTLNVTKIYAVANYSNQKTFYVDTNVPYTACYWEAGAAITCSPAIQKPGGEVTISWDKNKVKSGVNNNATKICLYYKFVNKAGETADWVTPATLVTGVANSSLKFTVPSLDKTKGRGTYIEFKAYIVGKEDKVEYNSGALYSGLIKINSLPETPTVTPNKTVLTSQENQVSFSIQIGTNNSWVDADGQQCAVKYSMDGGDIQDYTNNTNITITKNYTSFLFYTSDGLELSSPFSKILITKNINQPSFEVTTNVIDIDSIALSIEPINNSLANSNLYSCKMRVDSSSDVSLTINMTDKTGTNNETIQYEISNIRSQISEAIRTLEKIEEQVQTGLVQGDTYNITFEISRNDGIETLSKTSESTVASFQVPTLEVQNNNKDNIKYFGGLLSVTCSSENDWTLKKEEDNEYVSVSDDWVQRGGSLNAIKFLDSGNKEFYVALNENQRMTRVMEPDLTIINPTTITPYTSITHNLNFNMCRLGDASNYGYDYGELFIKSADGNEYIINSASDGSGPNNQIYTLTPEHLWKTDDGKKGLAGEIWGKKYKEKRYQLTQPVEIKFTNVYGETFTKSATLSFDFSFKTQFSGDRNFYYDTGSESYSYGEKMHAVENMTIKPKGVVETCAPDRVQFVLWYVGENYLGPLTYKNGETLSTAYEFKLTDGVLLNPWVKNEGEAWVSNYRKIDLENLPSYIIPENREQADFLASVTLYAKDDDDSNTQASTLKSGEFEVMGIREPIVVPIAMEYADGTLSGSYEIKDFGLNLGGGSQSWFKYISKVDVLNSQSRSTIFETTGQEKYVEQSNTFETDGKSFFPDSIDFDQFYLEATAELTPWYEDDKGNIVSIGGAVTKTTIVLNYITVYNILPTMVYRKNCIGINVKEPDQSGEIDLPNSTFTVGAYNNQKIMYFVSSKNIGGINLLNGNMFGFVIDGGSWDQEEPINITNKPQELQILGLARIAYTGEIEDLEQDESTQIIVSGGSSTELIE